MNISKYFSSKISINLLNKLPLLLVLALAFSNLGSTLFAQNKVIAHRGFWDTEGSAQNSVTALRLAAEAGCFGSEFDVSITSDGVLVVNHDPSIKGHNIEKSVYADIKDITLKNGEKLPTLEQYLSEGAKHPEMKLILEIKPHKQEINENRAADSIMELVERMNLKAQVEYISFSLNICKRIIAKDKKAKVSYLNGELSPKQLKRLGFYGMDYNYKIYDKNPKWAKQAHRRHLKVNVWTVDNQDRLENYNIDKYFDFITTNKPMALHKR